MEMFDTGVDESNLKVCKRCIYDARVPSIEFDQAGVCNYCAQVDALVEQYGTGSKKGEELFDNIVTEIKNDGIGKQYDCVVGVSGGTDSSYLVKLATSCGLRPLAVHYDNTWNSAIATMNIQKVLEPLGVDLYTHVVHNKEADDIFRSFFFAGVAELDASTDLGYAYLLRKVARKYSVNYILEGHSFVEEGISPLGGNYFDGKYIQSIHKQFGRLRLKTYPLMSFNRFLRSAIFSNVKFIRPLWYLNYSKSEARAELEREFGWLYYGGHHLENRLTAYSHGVYLPQKFNTDWRNNTLAANSRNGYMTRQQAWREYNSTPVVERDIVEYFKKRIDVSDDHYDRVMAQSPKIWTEFPTYKKRFERLRPFFYLLAKMNRVPMSFYLKYCFPVKETDN